MKTVKLLVLLLVLANNVSAHCYSKIVSYSRNYIALQTDGTLWSKGTSFNGGLLGFGNTNAVANFTQIGTDSNWTHNISINGVNVFVIKTDGTLWVWGENQGGKLGIENLDDQYKTNVPIQVETETNWSKVSTGITSLAHAIKTDGALWSWGNNGVYLGYPNAIANNNYRSPKQIGTDTWQTISIGLFRPMIDGIKADGTLWGWGQSVSQSYMFGNGSDTFSSEFPIQIDTASDWKEIRLSQSTILHLKTNGTRWGWGRNTLAYQLGLGAGFTSDVIIPTQLDLDTDW